MSETRSRKEQAIAQQKLTPWQEEELVAYIEELTAHRITPTREIIKNFASSVAKERVSESWVTRFIKNYSIHLISRYSTGMNANRHNADSYAKYELYFNLLQRKIAEHEVDSCHTYDTDEKGFIIESPSGRNMSLVGRCGRRGRSKHHFKMAIVPGSRS
jgi:hypothetical protein